MLVSSRTTNILLILVLVVGIALVAILASGVRGGPLDPPGPPSSTNGVRLPGTPIAAPTTITLSGHYYLTNDINVSGAVNAIVINASDVSLDLGGFTVRGTDTVGSTGILMMTQTDIAVSNGSIKDFHIGLGTGTAQRVRVDRVHAISNIRGFDVGTKITLSNCLSMDNTETGIVVSGNESIVRNCTSYRNLADGIFVSGAYNLIEDSQVTTNQARGVVLQGDRNILQRSVLQLHNPTAHAGGDSPLVASGVENIVRGNTFGDENQVMHITGFLTTVQDNTGPCNWQSKDPSGYGRYFNNPCLTPVP